MSTTSWLWLALLGEPQLPPTVTTDRPDATNGTFTVAPGVWQLEAGMDAAFTREPGDAPLAPLSVPLALRIGMTERVELRVLDGEPLHWFDVRDDDGEGLAIGAKVRLLDVVPNRRRPSLGVQPYVAVPSAHPRSWLGTKIGLIGLWTQPLAAWLAFDANASLELGIPGEAPDAALSLFSVSTQVTASSRFIPYAEVYSFVDWLDPRASVVAVDAGLVMVVQRRLSFDLAARVDVVADRREIGFLGGISVILADGFAWRSRATRRGMHGRRRGS